MGKRIGPAQCLCQANASQMPLETAGADGQILFKMHTSPRLRQT
jgi:hypothetical protein